MQQGGKNGLTRRDTFKLIGAATAGGLASAAGADIKATSPERVWRPEPGFGNFDFGLSAAQEERARRLHGEAIIVDMMHQGAGGYLIFEEPFMKKRLEALSHLKGFALAGALEGSAIYAEDLAGRDNIMQRRWQASGVTCGTLGVSVGNLAGVAEQFYLVDSLPWLRKVTKAEHLRAAKRDGVHNIVGYHQPVMGLPRDLGAIEQAYQMGLRCLMLTYNNSDHVGCGCTERVEHGLTRYGVSVVELCNELGVLVDTAHTGKASTLDACRYSKQPVLANHTSAEAVHLHDRAKSDDEIRAIADTGGLIGIHAVPFFMARDRQGDVNDMLDHIDYVSELVGWEHVGIGTDWPLTAPKSALDDMFTPEFNAMIGFFPEHNIIPTQNMIGFDDYRDFPNFTRGMVKRGYTDEQITGILGGNFLRVFEQVCG